MRRITRHSTFHFYLKIIVFMINQRNQKWRNLCRSILLLEVLNFLGLSVLVSSMPSKPTLGQTEIHPHGKLSISPTPSSFINIKQDSLNEYLSRKLPDILDQSDETNALHELVQWLHYNDIKCIATDFDLTMLQVHSGGWIIINSFHSLYDSVLKSLSPSFTLFANDCRKQEMILCVVTFADSKTIPSYLKDVSIGGKDLVEAVINSSGNPFVIDDIFAFYPRYNHHTSHPISHPSCW